MSTAMCQTEMPVLSSQLPLASSLSLSTWSGEREKWPATAPRLLRTRAKCTGSHRIAEHRGSPLVRTRERDIRKICIKEIHRTRWQFFCRLFLLSPRLVCRIGEKENKEIHRNDDKHAKNFFTRRAEDSGSHAYSDLFSSRPSKR